MKNNNRTYTLSLNIPAYLDFDAPADATDEELIDLAQKAFNAYLQDKPEIRLDVYTADTYADGIIQIPDLGQSRDPHFRDINLDTQDGILYKE